METYKYKNEDNYLKAKKKVKAYKGFYVHLAVYLIVNSFITANRVISNVYEDGETYIDALFSINTFFIWVPWGIGLLIHGLVVFEVFKFLLGRNWEERKIKELMEKEKDQFKSI